MMSLRAKATDRPGTPVGHYPISFVVSHGFPAEYRQPTPMRVQTDLCALVIEEEQGEALVLVLHEG